MDLLIGCMFVTAIAVLAGLVFGFRALVWTANHSKASAIHVTAVNLRAVKLIAFNLLEPTVTMTVGFVTLMVLGGKQMPDEIKFTPPAIALIPFTWMLLAPVWTRLEHSIRRTLITYGVLRWLNTLAFWYFGIRALTESSSNDLATLTAGFIVSGTLMLCVSFAHLALSLSEFQAKPVLTPKRS